MKRTNTRPSSVSAYLPRGGPSWGVRRPRRPAARPICAGLFAAGAIGAAVCGASRRLSVKKIYIMHFIRRRSVVVRFFCLASDKVPLCKLFVFFRLCFAKFGCPPLMAAGFFFSSASLSWRGTPRGLAPATAPRAAFRGLSRYFGLRFFPAPRCGAERCGLRPHQSSLRQHQILNFFQVPARKNFFKNLNWPRSRGTALKRKCLHP